MSIRSALAVLAAACVVLAAPRAHALTHPELEFKVFQFPRDQIPRIDGDTTDWDMVPASYVYGSDLVNDTSDGNGVPDPADLQFTVKVGWVKGDTKLYFLYEAYDDFWDFGRFNPGGYSNDIFEIAVDGDLSGGQFINNAQIPDAVANHFAFSGVHAQNYHIYTPPVNNGWVLVWGCQPWISWFPWSNYAYDYDFKPGESGKLVLECYITPFDYAPYDGPARAVPSALTEDKLIGLAWSILDFDGGARDGHYNLAHDTKMVSDGSYLCGFRLMPLERQFQKPIAAEWSFEVIDMERRLVAFSDESTGDVTGWKWDFGDGTTSTERNPIHAYAKPGIHMNVTLEVTGPSGSDTRTRFWEVSVK